jgi:arsenical pump membrane protein
VLNLDTSVFFLTPVLLHVARARGVDEQPFLYGAVFMSNSASLFLPGSNLTNLIVLHGHPVAGRAFLTHLLPSAVAAVVTTAAVLLVWFARQLHSARPPAAEAASARLGAGLVGVAGSIVLVLVLANPALPVLGVAVATAVAVRVDRQRVQAAVNLPALALLFVLAVALGALGRAWNGPAHLVSSVGSWPAAALSALAAVAVNNLPASVLLTPHPPAHMRALLIGINLGPNLAVTGSLSAILWLRVARSLGAAPSIRTYSLIGVVLVPLSIAAAIVAPAIV